MIYTGHAYLSPAKLEMCVPSDMMMKGTGESPTVSIDSMSIRMLLSSSISPYLCHPPPVCSVHFGIEAFRWRIAVEAMLRGIHVMLGVGYLPHHPSHSFDDVLTPEFDRVLVIVIPSPILKSG